MKYFFGVIIPSKSTQALSLINIEKMIRYHLLFCYSVIYTDLESLVKRIDGCKIILKNHLQQK